MTPEQLKASILQYAIQGKLVEQRPEEGTAEDLYKAIQEEKQKLIKEGKFKKEKPLSEITEDEMPFDIPDSWKWVRIGDIYSLTMGQSPDGNSVSKGLDGMEFHQGKVFFGKDYIQKSDQVTSQPSKIAEPNSVLLCVRAPVGIVNITDRELCIGRGLCAIKPLAGMTEKYALYSLRCLKEEFIKKATGTTFVAITGEVVKNQLIPLPPLAEQHRIVAKIEELLPFVDRYAASYEKLEQFNAKFPEDMKKSILQYAIQGKLVEQRPEEGTSEELYQQIQQEKQKIEKKSKKSVTTDAFLDDEILIDIPETWKWVHLKDIMSVYGGKRIPAGKKLTKENTGHIYIRVSDMKDGSVMDTDIHYVPEDIYPIIKNYTISKDDVYITVAGTIGRVGIIPEKFDNANLTENADKLIIYSLNKEYVMYLMSSPIIQRQIIEATTKVGQPKLAIKRIEDMAIPLPPLKEQERIVAKIKELMPYCDWLVK